jgi:hypothetical protein
VIDLVDVTVPERTEQFAREFSSARPFRHVVMDNFLAPGRCDELMSEFPRFQAASAINERGETGRKAVVTDIPRVGPAYARFDRMIRGPQFLEWIGRVSSIPNLLYDPEYVGGGTHENLDGQDLDPHVDFNYHPRRHWHRRLNLIVFLNPEWRAEWGGCLELMADPWTAEGSRDARVVVPVANRAVLFETTERSWHGFKRIHLPPGHTARRSLAIYLYTEDRPEAETAASHGTVYVQPQLAGHVRPGHTLSEADVEEIRSLIGRRDQQIKFLYERELEFSSALDEMRRSPSFRLGRVLTWPARTLRGALRRRRDV